MAPARATRPAALAAEPSNGLRDFLMRWVQSGTVSVVAFQRMCGITSVQAQSAAGKAPAAAKRTVGDVVITNRVLHFFFLTAAAAGNELFYIVAFPFLFWCVDFALARRIAFVWAVIYFVGQAAKDLLRLPRPPSPPVTRLETHYETEYGFPSTHAMVSLVLPFYALCVCADKAYDIDYRWGLLAAVCWCASISLSRLYVGVHSVCDLCGGLFLGAWVLAFGWWVGPSVDAFVSDSAWAPPVEILLSLLAIAAYPAPAAWTNAYGDTALIIATAAGISCACTVWLPRHEVPPIQWNVSCAHASCTTSSWNEQLYPLCSALVLKLFRMLVGCSVLFLTRFTVKRLATMLWLPLVLPRYFGWAALIDQPPTHQQPDDTAAPAAEANGVHDSSSSSSSSNGSREAADRGVEHTAALAAEDVAEAVVGDGASTESRNGSNHSLQKRKPHSSTSAGAEVAASASALSASTTSCEPDGEGRLISPQPQRPVVLAPAQFRLSVPLSQPKAAATPELGLDENTLAAQPLLVSHLRVLWRSPSPPHSLQVAGAEPWSLASFHVGGRELLINPMHVYLVEIPIKYATYFAVGFNAVCSVPMLFQFIGI